MPTISQFGGIRIVMFLKYQKELEEMWETGQYEKLPPIV